MRIFSRKVFQGRALCTHILLFVLCASLLAACGDDPVSHFDDKTSELSSKKEDSSSSRVISQKTSSSSVNKGKVSSSSAITIELPPTEDGLDVVYVFVDGTVSGMIALDYFVMDAKIGMVQLDADSAYKETKTFYVSNVAKNGAYEINKINLTQPYVKFTVDGSIKKVADGKYASLSFMTLGDVTSGEIFNLNMLTTLEAHRVLELLKGNKLSFDEAKKKAAEEVWNMFHLESFDYDVSEMIHVSDISESGAALLAATVLLQGGSDDFAKFFKEVVDDIAKDGKWDDSNARLSIADWALTNDLKDGYASVRKTLVTQLGKAAEFEPYLKSFYLTELEFPTCDAENAGEIFFVKNKSSKFYAATYDDVSKSTARFVCDEQKGWLSIPDSLKDFMGETATAEDGDVRRGAFSGEFYTYDGTKKEWRKSTAIEKDRYFVLASNVKEFVDIQDVYENVKDDERVIFVLRHAERGDDTSKGGTLTDNGKKQSEEVGARLTKFKEDFVLGASEFLRAHQTVMSIAKGRGQSYDTRDTLPQLNDDWYAKNSEAVEKAKSECGGGWEVTSKYAYTGAYSTGADAAYYDLAERSVELIEDVLLKKYTKEKFVLLSSHDKLMVPLVAYCSNLQINLRKYDGGKWINYLAGVAIIVDKAGNRRYIAIRGLKSGFAD
ncbi:histidine phosphatase family protein [Fibrobacter sp. UWB12]|uniref:histidine phosphatase family protein n=1 Tax=Fibrobacter sp. UWB12 TaxID=1896203 RepID=UPI00090F1C8F|nr:histidine phosphatase family protein [Fibrobacter sp. UWB12]SHK97691.1 Broad specificity phosphatase PhoE [Fibrobacter sp. UWB12]